MQRDMGPRKVHVALGAGDLCHIVDFQQEEHGEGSFVGVLLHFGLIWKTFQSDHCGL